MCAIWSADMRRWRKDELLFRFEFPERPGALMNFLDSMSPDWNISLFHYRNHGADYGRVLVGMQVPPKEMPQFRRFLTTSAIRTGTRARTRRTGCSSAEGRNTFSAGEESAIAYFFG